MTAAPAERHVLRGVRLVDGARRDVTLDGGRVADVGPAGSAGLGGARVHHLDGWLVTPSLVEPHTHLDKALTAGRAPNPSGDLDGAIRAWLSLRGTLTADDLRARARTVLARAAAHGVTTLRTHVDTGVGLGVDAVGVLADLRADLAPALDLQIVAGHGLPVTGRDGAAQRALLREALHAGADAVGGAPSLDADPAAAFDLLADVAERAGVPLDLHVDETLDPRVFVLDHVARRARHLGVPLTVGHVVSLAAQPAAARRRVAGLLADAGVGVVTLPQSNLYLQGRGAPHPAPRGLTAVDELLAAGVVVAAGADNVGDPFNPLGRADPLETASLLVAAGHLSPEEAFEAVTDGARRAVGLPAVAVRAGEPADLLVARATDLTDLVATAPAERLVFRAGRLVAATAVSRTWAGSDLLTTGERRVDVPVTR